jgi:uncharacterized membrane protein
MKMKLRKPPKWLVQGIAGVVTLLASIGIFFVIRRMLTLANVIEPFVQPTYGAFDAEFARRPILTLIHIIPGFLFMVLGPLQFVPQIRARYIQFHRWSGRVFIIASVVIGVSALQMAFSMSIGGANETAATTLFAIVFLFTLGKAFYHIRCREIAQHREWMIRSFAIGLAVATVRPIVGMFFAFSRLSPHEFFGIAFWLGFTIHLIAAEVWINYTRATPRHD